MWQLPGGTLALVVGAGLCGPDLGQVWRVELHGPLGQEGQGKVRGTPSCSLLEKPRGPRGESHFYVSINLSASDFHTSRLIARINQKTEQYAVRPQQIKFEVTEHAFLDVEKMTPIILAFRQAGYEVAIDDFGIGYSNLHNLKSLNVDILKIDKSFVETLTTHKTSHLIAEHIIELAHSLGLKTIAEGVETEEQVNWLRKRGVRYCQGWFFAKAMPPQVFMQWMEQLPARELTRGQ